jgi:hypothetical protein
MRRVGVTAVGFVVALGCGSSPPAERVVTSTSAAPATSTPAPTTTAMSNRCRELPVDTRLVTRPNCHGALNSDGTHKRLPASPPAEPGHAVLFRIEDFGPPVMYHDFLGTEWWSWDAGGHYQPCDEFDVRVVVHDGSADIAAQFPTVVGKSDYRLVTRADALRYLDAQIAELASPRTAPAPYVVPLGSKLSQTRQVITSCLPN